MEVNIHNLIDDVRCYEAVRDLRWPEQTHCPHCDSFTRYRDSIAALLKQNLQRHINLNTAEMVSNRGLS